MNARKILITGAAGRIGSAFWQAYDDKSDLRLADLDVSTLAQSAQPFALDISVQASCLEACEGIHTVIHLAADPHPDADFMSSLLPVNIVGTYNMLFAAKAQGCKRFIFASSAQAIEGYPEDVQVQEWMAPKPGNLYGVSKAFGEALASMYANDGQMTTIAVRIANVAIFHPGENHSHRDVAAFISIRDVVALLNKCVEAELSGFHVIHGVSDNRYKRLSIDKTRTVVGYTPLDDGFEILEGHAQPE
ncbi:NAD-dependent epimerase/dehydratase family protein [Pseudomonas taetrolens]|uniref:NAD-dependent epimerase/dehydratase family protein n=1 Tax=Pseudomonas TaxID=286 RepID=UPI001C500C44|nr:NAD(P)-dependent oxidoreductase [Pseudomonas sp. D1HM]MBW0236417.1 epimerase [Pseudomonas sp. D1HM]